MATKGFLYLDLEWKVTNGFLYLGTWGFTYKRLKFGIRLLIMSALLFRCFEMYDLPFPFLDLNYLNFPF